MARTADPKIENKILKAAHRLWLTHGEEKVTLRAVAKAAGTTTPTLYKRFPTKEALMRAVALRVRQAFVDKLLALDTLEEVCRAYLQEACKIPHEYQYIYGPMWPQVFGDERTQFGLEEAKARLAASHGGSPEQYSVFVNCIWLLLHGTASLIVQHPNTQAAKRIREHCLKACEQLLQSPGALTSDS